MSIIPLPGGQGSVISSLILPQYPEGATAFSGSIPFAGNGLALHNLAGDEFVASYSVVADQVGPAARVDEIVNPSPLNENDGNGGDGGDGGDDGGDGGGDGGDGDGGGDGGDGDGGGDGGDGGGDGGDGDGGGDGGGN